MARSPRQRWARKIARDLEDKRLKEQYGPTRKPAPVVIRNMDGEIVNTVPQSAFERPPSRKRRSKRT